VTGFRTDDEAVALANGGELGLTAAIQSADPDGRSRWARVCAPE
jgi:acyl-CoA reductase-like NAD-dependent aldehyde dehydrogenase